MGTTAQLECTLVSCVRRRRAVSSNQLTSSRQSWRCAHARPLMGRASRHPHRPQPLPRRERQPLDRALEAGEVDGHVLADAPLDRRHWHDTLRRDVDRVRELGRRSPADAAALEPPLAAEGFEHERVVQAECELALLRVALAEKLGHVHRERRAKVEACHLLRTLLEDADPTRRVLEATRDDEIGHDVGEVVIVGEHAPHFFGPAVDDDGRADAARVDTGDQDLDRSGKILTGHQADVTRAACCCPTAARGSPGTAQRRRSIDAHAV
mmetsp:Transcript_60188/g.164906  ORF Transcript_60188/g.164906 Transcript_60188/m.164906 type:complete len:267 (+) Transcript_60188:87-887(+)